jgi:hypothetical protein
MKLKIEKKYLMIVAVVSMAMSSVASAATFNATATVQNALTVTADAGAAGTLRLGTVFAVTASSGAYKYMTLGTADTIGAPAGHASIILLSLGGQGSAHATVAVGNTTAFTLTLPNAEPSAVNADGVTNASTLISGSTDVIWVQPADTSQARFQLINFRAGTPVNATAAAGCATTISCVLTPSFGATSVGFGIGATIVTDTAGGTHVAYTPTSHTGTFTVTASY